MPPFLRRLLRAFGHRAETPLSIQRKRARFKRRAVQDELAKLAADRRASVPPGSRWPKRRDGP